MYQFAWLNLMHDLRPRDHLGIVLPLTQVLRREFVRRFQAAGNNDIVQAVERLRLEVGYALRLLRFE